LPRHFANQTLPFKVHNHLVDARWRNLKIPLHVGFRRRNPIQFGEVINESQILTLLVCVFHFFHGFGINMPSRQVNGDED